MVSWVVKVLEAITKRVVSGLRERTTSLEKGRGVREGEGEEKEREKEGENENLASVPSTLEMKWGVMGFSTSLQKIKKK